MNKKGEFDPIMFMLVSGLIFFAGIYLGGSAENRFCEKNGFQVGSINEYSNGQKMITCYAEYVDTGRISKNYNVTNNLFWYSEKPNDISGGRK